MNGKLLKSLVLCLFLVLGGRAQAWWDPGHMLTAQIAYDHLSPVAKEKADALIQRLMQDYPYTNNFVSAATWPDDIKAEGVHVYDAWHYTNIPYNPEGINVPANPEQDVVWAIKECKNILYKKTTRDIEKARALAFLIHFVGDVHQPLHSTSMYSHEHPGGDRGGNGYKVEGGYPGLHQVWDDACGLTSALNDVNPYGSPREPIMGEEMKRIAAMAKEISDKYPPETAEVEQDDPDFWALESHKLAVKYGYTGKNGSVDGRNQYLKPGDKLTEDYLAAGKEIAGKRIALGGYRLARLLNQVWK